MRAAQPEHPRVRTGVRWFEADDGLVVRSTTGSFVFGAGQHHIAERLLTSLDGERSLEQLLAGYAALEGLTAIALLSALASLGLIVEGRDAVAAAPSSDFTQSWPANASVAVRGEGLLADALRQYITPVGGTPRPAEVTLDILGLDGPDLSRLDAENHAAYDARRPWFPVFPFGDATVVGPLIRPGRTSCFGCFELRWLGISPSIAFERQYLARLRNGECAVREVSGREAAARLAARIMPILARGVCRQEATSSEATSAREPSVGWLLSTDSDEVHELRIEAHPLCETCGRGDRLRQPGPTIDAAFWHEPGGDLLEAGANIAGLVDPFVGIATVVPLPKDHDIEPAPGCPEIVLTRYAVPQPDLISSDQSNFTHGARDDVEAARAVAAIEAIERYCGLFPPEADIVATFADVEDSALLPTELPLFSSAQYATPGFSYRPFAPDQLLGWTWGWNVTRGERVLVPSTAVWYGAEDLLVGETSNGMAAHTGRGPALHNGALELIERDAFMIHWLHRISPARFEREELRGDAAAMVGRIEQQGYAIALADLTTDLEVPVVLALGIHELGLRPALLVGAGASLDGSIAVSRAVRELYAAAMGIPADWKLGPLLQPDDVVELADHSRAYEHPEWLDRASFLWAGPVTSQPPSEPNGGAVADDLDRLVNQLAGKGHDVIGVDISTPEVAARRGVRVVRAIVPGLQPLAFGTRVRLGGRRLYEAPLRMDVARPARTEAELNPAPHCFP